MPTESKNNNAIRLDQGRISMEQNSESCFSIKNYPQKRVLHKPYSAQKCKC